MTKDVFPFVYLGVPIFQDRCKAIYFDHLVEKVRRAWAGWKAKALSFGGLATLIKYVLMSFPIYSLASSNVPKSVLRSIERLMANLLWNVKGESRTIGLVGPLYALQLKKAV